MISNPRCDFGGVCVRVSVCVSVFKYVFKFFSRNVAYALKKKCQNEERTIPIAEFYPLARSGKSNWRARCVD